MAACSPLGFSCCAGASGVSSAGTLNQLIALGAADYHLTADATTTYWRLRIEKCTNFAMESIQQTFTGNAQFGSEVQITLNRTGDLIYWMYVVIDIPAIVGVQLGSGGNRFGPVACRGFPYAKVCNPCGDAPDLNCCDNRLGNPLDRANNFGGGVGRGGGAGGRGRNDGFDSDSEDEFDEEDDCGNIRRPFANWVNAIGYAAIPRVGFSIGGQIIDCMYNSFMFAWEELSGKPGKRLEEMIGKRWTREQLVRDSRWFRRLYAPIPFYFTQHSGNALPIVSLQYHSVQVHVVFAPLQTLIQQSDCDVQVLRCDTGLPIANTDMHAVLETTYVYLDMEERDKFACGSFQQLITVVQQYTTSSCGGTIRAALNFNFPTLELIWMVQRACQCAANNTFDYSGFGGRDPIETARLTLNNAPRFEREAKYFRLVQPYQFHTNIPRGFIYSYSFALEPESCQPSGSLNFSRIDNVEFTLTLQPEIAGTEVLVYIFARSWNVMRYKEGLGGKLYSS